MGSTDNKKQVNTETWPQSLPREIAFEILSRLPITSLQHCKSVNRALNSSIRDSLLEEKHLSRAADHSICIILYSNSPQSKLDVLHIEESNCYTKTPKELSIPFQHLLPYFDIFCSCNGLLCLSNLIAGDPIYIYNPIERAFRDLPRLPTKSDLSVFSVVFGFGFHPKAKTYKVVVMVYYTQASNLYLGVHKEAEAYVLTLGTPSWRHVGKVPYKLIGPTSEVLVNGRLHWLTNNYRDIVSFDIESEEFEQVPPQPSCGVDFKRSNYHLVELGGCLCGVVSKPDKTNEIWVMKRYNVSDSWVREFVIADHVPPRLHMIIRAIPGTRPRRSGTNKKGFRVLCRLRNGEMLIAYDCCFLVCYNPESGGFKDLEFDAQLPVLFETTVHLGSLVSVDAAFGMSREEL